MKKKMGIIDIEGSAFVAELQRLGLIPEMSQRIIIDIDSECRVTVYVQALADKRLEGVNLAGLLLAGLPLPDGIEPVQPVQVEPSPDG